MNIYTDTALSNYARAQVPCPTQKALHLCIKAPALWDRPVASAGIGQSRTFFHKFKPSSSTWRTAKIVAEWYFNMVNSRKKSHGAVFISALGSKKVASGKRLHSYWQWPSRNSWFSHEKCMVIFLTPRSQDISKSLPIPVADRTS